MGNRKPIIKHNDRIITRFSFKGNTGPVSTTKLWGKRTPFPMYYYGATREKDGHTWWIIGGRSAEYGITDPVILNNTTPGQREAILLTDEEIKKLSPSNNVREASMIRDDSRAWDIYETGKYPSPSSNAKQWDTKIDTYLAKEQDTNTTQPLETGIKKLHNYTPVKVMNKINEIIDHLNND